VQGWNFSRPPDHAASIAGNGFQLCPQGEVVRKFHTASRNGREGTKKVLP
jgi:hypothetical protein